MQKKTTEIDQGTHLDEAPDTSNSSGWGYTEMGKVIMVRRWANTSC